MVHFDGLNTRHAKRRALSYWYTNRGSLEMSLTEFFGCCRLTTSGSTARITFYLTGCL